MDGVRSVFAPAMILYKMLDDMMFYVRNSVQAKSHSSKIVETQNYKLTVITLTG